jgi:ABC-type glutathione transport system ATPase component
LSPEPEALLDIEGLCVSYGHGPAAASALRGVSLRLGHGEAVGLIGETGSGKSTLARAVLGLVVPSAGRMTLAGQELTALGPRQWRELRRRGLVQYVFQDPLRSLDPDLTVEDSIAEPLLARGGRAGDLARSRVRELVVDQLRRMGLGAELLGRHPGELSGGQRQRVAVARALITEPRLLILDEPVSALDAANRAQVLQRLSQLGQGGVTLLFISHDLGSVAAVTDRIAVLHRGILVEVDGTDAIVHRPRHPYTRLLVGSAPTLARGAISRARRQQLRAELSAAGERLT